MALSLQKIVLANAATNTAGAFFQPVVVAATSSGVVVPGGLYQLLPTTNVVIQMNTSNNLSSPTWVNLAAVNTGVALFVSDGVNVQALSTNAAANVTLYTVNGGAAVSGTFNAT